MHKISRTWIIINIIYLSLCNHKMSLWSLIQESQTCYALSEFPINFIMFFFCSDGYASPFTVKASKLTRIQMRAPFTFFIWKIFYYSFKPTFNLVIFLHILVNRHPVAGIRYFKIYILSSQLKQNLPCSAEALCFSRKSRNNYTRSQLVNYIYT